MLAQAYHEVWRATKDGELGSLGPIQRLVETWTEAARDEDIERVVQTLKDELAPRARYPLRAQGRGIGRLAGPRADSRLRREGRFTVASPSTDPN